MLIIISKIFSIFLITGVGFVANKTNVLPYESNKYMVDLMMLITSPCMIISSLTSADSSGDMAALTTQALIFSALFFIGSYLFSSLLCKKIYPIKAEDHAGIYMIAIATLNNGFMGFPITYALFSDEVFFCMVLFNFIHVVYVYSAGIVQVNYGFDSSTSFKTTLRYLVNPCTIAAGFSLIILFCNLQLPEPILDSIDIIGDATVPISMLLVGIQLGSSNIPKIIRNKKLVIISFAKMIFLPLLTFLAVNWLPISTSLKIALTFGAAFPAAVAIVAITSMQNRNSILAAELVAFTTLISMVTLPIAATLLMAYYQLL